MSALKILTQLVLRDLVKQKNLMLEFVGEAKKGIASLENLPILLKQAQAKASKLLQDAKSRGVDLTNLSADEIKKTYQFSKEVGHQKKMSITKPKVDMAETVKSEVIDYKGWNPKVESFYDELVENAYKESKKTGRDVQTIIEETIDYKFTGNETGKEILDIIEEKFFKADGGRIGFNQGGNLGLTEQAQGIYDSWIDAGHSEEDTLAYLESRGLYNAPVVQEGIIKAPNIINQNLGGDGGGGRGNTITSYDPNINLGPNKDVIDYEADAYGIGPTFRGQFAKFRNAFSKIPTPFNIAKMGIEKAQDWADQRRIEKEKALQAQITAQANQTAKDLVAGGASPDWGKTETRSSSGWENSPFAKGGLATMFTRRR